MTRFDFFQAEELPVPAITAAQAHDIATTHFGIDGEVTALGSQQDANFLLSQLDGRPIGVLKIANPAFSRVEIEAQDAAAEYLSQAGCDVRAATNLAFAGVDPIAEVRDGNGAVLYARVIAHLAGGTLSGDRYITPMRSAALGALAGRTVRALADFDHPGVDRVLQWDLRHALRTVELLAEHVPDPGRRETIEAAAAAAWQVVADLADDLPVQVIHGDLTDDNVVCSTPENGQLPDGVIDLGDLTRSWTVGELAIAVSSLLRHEGGEPVATLPAVAAFHAVRPLSPPEIDALWPLVVLRAAVLVVSGIHQASIDADNAYAAGALDYEWRIFERAIGIPTEVMTATIRAELGAAQPIEPPPVTIPLIDGLAADAVVRLDLSSEADAMDAGRWLTADCEDDLAAEALAGGAGAVVTTFGQPRTTRSVPLSPESSATVGTGLDLWRAAPSTVTAPWDCVIDAAGDDSLTLTGTAGTVQVRGRLCTGEQVRPGEGVTAGTALGTVEGRIWIQWRSRPDVAVPDFVRAEYSAGWLSLVEDPSALLGLPAVAAEADDSEALWRRRADSFATVQEHYYLDPPRIERGWREHMVSTDARSYLDMVNNVAILGHGHPVLADAVARQWRRLNTNSRFNYAAVVALSERLAATLPDPLDTVFLVNSGSEAGDLALRLAMATTGRHDIVSMAEAYHGWTYATDAVSTSVADNPNALATRPSWVHTVPSPNAYRGEYRGPDAVRYAPEAVEIIERLAAQGNPPAAFICEPFYGNAGGMSLPDGYLSAVYAAVRAAGGLAIADEVQVGYGRTGRWFWSFQQQDVVPDIVTVAKAMGNGQPLGAVITTRAIAERYRTQGYFFSSAGGSPVSCVVGLTVLEQLEKEGLQHNALVVGDHLRARIEELATRHELIGTVHGSGLYMGVELVRDRTTLEPAVSETAAICERLLELGVIVQPTGDRQNVLKVKPPMCITRESADFFVDMLERVLNTGW
ncbi:aminotransferase [Mycolicibacterium rhodesiae]|uniref:4-aminobutyrate aminotransferase n=1 Tax=Mycolicibacterium rhodesiae TaxID=36814 RepID=A0A1X0IJ74_MYCRH|nr:aminotransferase [Mycolicibacterium rhodesiae]MCV7343966.1 aminotransferase [Mycolicibacterium rhodesiae]ORB47170.1 4-aminobutyrate aminotransferase [Mycolicibacterium rhodesiae]